MGCASAQVKLFVELFTNKFGSYIYKLLRAQSEEEVAQLSKELEKNLEVSRAGGQACLQSCSEAALMQPSTFMQPSTLVDGASCAAVLSSSCMRNRQVSTNFILTPGHHVCRCWTSTFGCRGAPWEAPTSWAAATATRRQ